MKCLNVVKTHGLRDALPKYPKVIVDGDVIVIVGEDGDRMVWDWEPDKADAERVAEEIEIGLKSIFYVRSRLIDLLSDVVDRLTALDVPPEMLDWVIDDAYNDVSRNLPSIIERLKSR
jgi:hypothetical protein